MLVGWPDDWCGRITGGTRYGELFFRALDPEMHQRHAGDIQNPKYNTSLKYLPICLPRLDSITENLANSRRSKIFLISLFFICISIILASARFGGRVTSLLAHLKPSTPVSSVPVRPLANSSMAPQQYRKPPQAPPKFTATPSSLIEDTHKLVCQSGHHTLCIFLYIHMTPQPA